MFLATITYVYMQEYVLLFLVVVTSFKVYGVIRSYSSRLCTLVWAILANLRQTEQPQTTLVELLH